MIVVICVALILFCVSLIAAIFAWLVALEIITGEDVCKWFKRKEGDDNG